MHVVFNLHYQMFVIHMENKQQQQLLRMNLLLNVKNELQQIKELQEIMIKWKIIYRCLYLFSIMFSGNKLIKIKFFYFSKKSNLHVIIICSSLYSQDRIHRFFSRHDLSFDFDDKKKNFYRCCCCRSCYML
jgi:hypothetical protein